MYDTLQAHICCLARSIISIVARACPECAQPVVANTSCQAAEPSVHSQFSTIDRLLVHHVPGVDRERELGRCSCLRHETRNRYPSHLSGTNSKQRLHNLHKRQASKKTQLHICNDVSIMYTALVTAGTVAIGTCLYMSDIRSGSLGANEVAAHTENVDSQSCCVFLQI